MTYDEAAKWFEDYPPLAIWDEEDGGYDEVPHEAIHLAANTLRAVRDAQSDARKGFEQAFEHWMDNPPPHFHDKEVAVVALQEQNNWAPLKRVCFRDGFDAGHAQGYAAGLAAQKAKDTQAERDNWVVICNRWKEMYDTVIADLATAKADALELANEVRRCWTEMEASLATICEMHMLGKAHEIEMLCKDRPAAVTAAMERY